MSIRRKASVAVLATAPLLLTSLATGSASAHGTSSNPPSRIQICSAQGGETPENPQHSACRAAKAATGSAAAFYDPNAVSIGQANGRHRELIKDGELCSAGNPVYKGLDLPRTDWPTTNLPSGKEYTFQYFASAPHKGGFEYYLTKDGYDPTKPLKWSDLEAKPFLTGSPTVNAGTYTFKGKLPARSGRHLLYVIWQRTDSAEAFYSCSDVVFDGSGRTTTGKEAQEAADKAYQKPGGPSTTKPTTAITPTSAPTPTADTTTPIAAAPKHPDLAETGTDNQSLPVIATTAATVLTLGITSLYWARRRQTKSHH
ncbi:lytic polysaccharide monooxygenase [Embleya sp. NBC_00896]|uniref:lytic polysaccharide monooxygenase auxiliary activity family 9 protein n=1 Tax=Embleya sp. NBC_00896 TaxID=2975961 RepID=UPI003869EC8B|nr:lytic polysaccharide monooxygenase [Embleya sp. NBC_00896]